MLAIVNCLAGNSKFTGHSRRLHTSLVFTLDCNLTREGKMDFPSNQLTLYMLEFERYHLRAYIKGEYTIYLMLC